MKKPKPTCKVEPLRKLLWFLGKLLISLVRKIKIIASVLVLAGVISYFLLDANEKQFDQNKWNNNPLERYKMSKDIIESNLLIEKTKAEVLLLLGEAEVSELQGKEHLIYEMGKPPSFFESKVAKLVVIFEDAKAVKVIHSHE